MLCHHSNGGPSVESFQLLLHFVMYYGDYYYHHGSMRRPGVRRGGRDRYGWILRQAFWLITFINMLNNCRKLAVLKKGRAIKFDYSFAYSGARPLSALLSGIDCEELREVHIWIWITGVKGFVNFGLFWK